MKKMGKNYYRGEVVALRLSLGESPVIFTGRYKHSSNDAWAVFTTIRPYTPGQRSPTICNHVNIQRRTIDRYSQVSELDHNHKFYFVGRSSTYMHYGEERGCIEIASDLACPVFWKATPTERSDAYTQAAAVTIIGL